MFNKQLLTKNKPSMSRFIYYYQKTVILKKQKGTTVGDELTPSILHGGGRFTQDNQHFLFMFNTL